MLVHELIDELQKLPGDVETVTRDHEFDDIIEISDVMYFDLNCFNGTRGYVELAAGFSWKR